MYAYVVRRILLTCLLLIVETAHLLAVEGYVKNQGQIVDQNGQPNHGILYQYASRDLIVRLRNDGYTYELRQRQDSAVHSHRIDVQFAGCSNHIVVTEDVHGTAVIRDYRGNSDGSPSNVVRQLTYHNVYPNVDVRFKLTQDLLPEFDIMVRPGGTLADVQLAYTGVTGMQVTERGLGMRTRFGEFVETVPAAWEQESGKEVKAQVHVSGSTVRFDVPQHDPNSTLVIDPVPWLSWATFIGGRLEDQVTALEMHPGGGFVVVGSTQSADHIATAGASQQTLFGEQDVFVARYDHDTLLWATYLGGDSSEFANGLVIDNSGNIYIAGETSSDNNIATTGAFQDTFSGFWDAFLIKLDKSGARTVGTYFGGTGEDYFTHMAWSAASKRIYCVGSTNSDSLGLGTIFQSTKGNPNYPSLSDGLIVEFDENCTPKSSTYLGSEGNDELMGIAVADSGMLYVTGQTTSQGGLAWGTSHQSSLQGGIDIFLAKLNGTRSREWVTYVGGEGNEEQLGPSVAVGTNNTVYICGSTSSENDISMPGAPRATKQADWDGFINAFSADGVRTWGTYVGGNGYDEVYTLRYTSDDHIIVVGSTESDAGISQVPAYQEVLSGGVDGFFWIFNTSGMYVQLSYIGGVGDDQVLGVTEDAGTYYIYGTSSSKTGLVPPNKSYVSAIVGRHDGFITRFVPCEVPPFSIAGSNLVCMHAGTDTYRMPSLAGYTYQWSGPMSKLGVIVGSSTDSVVQVTWDRGGVDILRGTMIAPLGCSLSVDYDVEIRDSLPLSVAAKDGTFKGCVGDSIVLVATGGYRKYEWSNGDTTQTTTIVDSGSYLVTVFDSVCTRTSDSILVSIEANPSPMIVGAASVCLSGAPQQLYSITADINDIIIWDQVSHGTVLTEVYGVTSIEIRWELLGVDTVRVSVLNGSGCVGSAELIVSISNSRSLVVTGTSTLCLTQVDTVHLSVADNPGSSYIWFSTFGDFISSDTLAEVTIKYSSACTDSIIVVEGTSAGCLGTGLHVVSVGDSLAPLLNIFPGTEICDGDTAVLLVESGYDSYDWYRNDVLVQTGTLEGYLATQSGDYWVEVSSGQCSGTTSKVIITVLPVLSVYIVQDGNELVAEGTPADEYLWFDDVGQPISGATSKRYTPSMDGMYAVAIRVGNCTQTSTYFTYSTESVTTLFTVSDVAFGTVPVDDLINQSGGHVNEIIVVNVSSQNLTLDSATVDGTGFTIPIQFPRIMRPGDTSRITIRFAPTEYRPYSSTIRVYFGSEMGEAHTTGTGRLLAPDENITEVILQPQRIEIQPGDVFEVSISIGDERPNPTTALEYIATMQWDSRVLELVSTPEVFFRTTGREDNYFTAKIPEGQRTPGQRELIRIPFKAKLADVDSTVLVFSGVDAFRWKDNSKAYAACKDSVVHIRICREGGSRLVTKLATTQVTQVQPNPIESEALVSVTSTGDVTARLQLVDALGIIVRDIDLGTWNGLRMVNLSMEDLSAGPYVLHIADGWKGSSTVVIKR